MANELVEMLTSMIENQKRTARRNPNAVLDKFIHQSELVGFQELVTSYFADHPALWDGNSRWGEAQWS